MLKHSSVEIGVLPQRIRGGLFLSHHRYYSCGERWDGERYWRSQMKNEAAEHSNYTQVTPRSPRALEALLSADRTALLDFRINLLCSVSAGGAWLLANLHREPSGALARHARSVYSCVRAPGVRPTSRQHGGYLGYSNVKLEISRCSSHACRAWNISLKGNRCRDASALGGLYNRLFAFMAQCKPHGITIGASSDKFEQ